MKVKRENLALLELLKAALWGSDISLAECFPLSASEWQEVFSLAKEQTVLPLIIKGMEKLDSKLLPSDILLWRGAVATNATEKQGERHNAVVAELCSMFESSNIKVVLLKGQASALLYRQPSLRIAGDIDLYFPKRDQFRRANNIVKSKGIALAKAGDGSFHYEWQGIVVEHHLHFLNVANPAGSFVLHKIENKARFDTVEIGGAKIQTPAPLETLLLLNTHILSHAAGWGIGLRQLCDIACAYRAYRGRYDGRQLANACSKAGIMKWTVLLHSFLVDSLGMPEELLPFKGNRVDSAPLLRLVMRSGNFGFASSRRNGNGSLSSKISTALAFITNPFGWRYAPIENLCRIVNLTKNQD